MVLRDYQKDIIDQTIASNKSTLIQVPTGGGKTVIAKEIALELVNKHKLQVLFVAPKIILMEQTANVFKSLNPHIVHGVNEYNKDHNVLISTIQTASRRDIDPDVIFVDEIHYGFDGKMLQKLIKDKSDTRIIGLSATPYDKTGNQLKGFGLVLDKYDLKYMVENNFLVDIKSYVLTKIRKLDEVKVTAGDYNLKELSKIVSDNQTILEIVQSTAEYILEYKKTIVFAVDINHAELLTQAYQHEGFSVKVLHSKMSKDDIDRNIRLFRENQIKILVSVLMLTTGFDVPDTDVAVIARPTKSQNLYKQMVGRVLRIAENKNHAVLLDCANVIENLGMPLAPIKVVDTNENATNKQKCQDCGSENLSLRKDGDESFWECKDCGHKKEIERGAYECKMCNKLYTHDAKFEIKNDKLYLVCDTCPYPTLISEYRGDEKLVEVVNYLSFNEARAYVHALKLSSHADWTKYRLNQLEGYTPLPSNIPNAPAKFYKNKGWIGIDDWLGINASCTEEQKNQYLPFKEAREFVIKLNLEVAQWKAYANNQLDGYEQKPLNIPKKPQKAYKDKGWIDFDNWLGLDLKRQKELDGFRNIIIKKNIIETYHLLKEKIYDKGDELIEMIYNGFTSEEIVSLVDIATQSDDFVHLLMLSNIINKTIKKNNFNLFEIIAKKTYILSEESIEEQKRFSSYLAVNDKYFQKTREVLAHIEDKAIDEFLSKADTNSNMAIINYILCNAPWHNEFILKKAIEYELYELAQNVINTGIMLNDYLFGLDDNIDIFGKTLELFPNAWETYDASYIIDSIEDEWFYRILDIKELVDLLIKYGIDIKFDLSQENEVFIKFLLDNSLENNYKMDEKKTIVISDPSRLITDMSLYVLSKDSKPDWSDFELAVLHNFDVEVVKFIVGEINKNKISEDSILIKQHIKETSNSEILSEIKEDPLKFVLLKLVAAAYKNKNLAVVKFLKTFLPDVSNEHIDKLLML